MNLRRFALAGGCLAAMLAGSTGAMAQTQHGARVISVPPGAVVVVLSPTSSTLSANPAAVFDESPLLGLINEQQALMQRLMADTDALFPAMPDPTRLIQAALSQPLGTLAASGQANVCGESVTYSVPAPGAAPIVHVTRYGNACGAPSAASQAPETIRQSPAPTRTHSGVLEISYPPRPVPDHGTPRT
jgi:hypothetical protein